MLAIFVLECLEVWLGVLVCVIDFAPGFLEDLMYGGQVCGGLAVVVENYCWTSRTSSF